MAFLRVFKEAYITKCTEENITKLEHVFMIMTKLQQIDDPTLKQHKLQQVCQLLYDVGLISDSKDTTNALEVYNQHLLQRIREIVKMSQ